MDAPDQLRQLRRHRAGVDVLLGGVEATRNLAHDPVADQFGLPAGFASMLQNS
jgi:hypothetical protein